MPGSNMNQVSRQPIFTPFQWLTFQCRDLPSGSAESAVMQRYGVHNHAILKPTVLPSRIVGVNHDCYPSCYLQRRYGNRSPQQTSLPSSRDLRGTDEVDSTNTTARGCRIDKIGSALMPFHRHFFRRDSVMVCVVRSYSIPVQLRACARSRSTSPASARRIRRGFH